MSLPPTMRRTRLPRYSRGGMFAKAGLLAIMEMKSRLFPPCRSFHSFWKYSRHSKRMRSLSSSVMFDAPTSSGLEVAASDQKGRRCRSSKGKSKSVASICVVSSMETAGTQSKRSPTGRPSRIVQTRWRISGSRLASCRGATAGCTALRWWSWRG